jgi:hypothetical protein
MNPWWVNMYVTGVHGLRARAEVEAGTARFDITAVARPGLEVSTPMTSMIFISRKMAPLMYISRVRAVPCLNEPFISSQMLISKGFSGLPPVPDQKVAKDHAAEVGVWAIPLPGLVMARYSSMAAYPMTTYFALTGIGGR